MEPEHDLSAYLPAPLLRYLARNQVTRLTPCDERTDAAVLFGDIIGFTALAEHLAERGAQGAELLSSVLESVFGAIVETVESHGGDVIAFAGDAVIAVWPPGPGRDLESCVRAAAASGLAVQQALEHRTPAQEEAIRARVAIDVGLIRSSVVGGVADRWLYVVAGPPIERIGELGGSVQPGEVRLSAAAAGYLSATATTREDSAGFRRLIHLAGNLPTAPTPSPPEISEDVLRAFVPRAVRRRLQAGQSGWLAEFRRVSVLFAGLSGLTAEGEEPLGRLQDAVAALQAAVHQFGGSVNQFLIDDKGPTLLAVWGLPHTSHEDDANRAVRAAMAIREAMSRQRITTACGVTTGRAFSGIRGSRSRSDYAVFGTIVNLAARLMTRAGRGGILCDEATAHSARTSIEFEALAPIEVKGVSESVSVLRPTRSFEAATPGTRRFGALVGRADQLARLRAAIRSLRATGAGATVLIEGEPGIGKSHLLDTFAREAAGEGLTVIQSAADAIESSTAYYAWRDVLRCLFEGVNETQALRVEARTRLAAAGANLEWLPLLNPLLPLGLDETEATRQLEASARADRTQELVVQLLRHKASDSPLVLAFEDVHWFDTLSWALAAQVARQVQPCIVAMTLRPMTEPVLSDYAQLAAAVTTARIQLEALAPVDATAILRNTLGAEDMPDTVARFVTEKSGGNPFFTEQLALALRDRGYLAVENGRARLASGIADLSEAEVPDTVERVVTGRIDLLSAQQQLTVKVASVIGRLFGYRTLYDVHPIHADRPSLPAQLDDIERRDLIRSHAPEPNLAYLFKHALVQEVAYSLLAFAQRQQLHRGVAEWLETRHGGELDSYLPLLAHHWVNAADRGKAIGYLERAGKQSLDQFANAEAIRFLEQAMRLDANDAPGVDDQQRSRWEWWTGVAYLKLSDYDECARHQDRGLALLGFHVPKSRIGLVLTLLGQIGRQAMHRLLPESIVAPTAAARARFRQASEMYQYRSEYGFFNTDALWALQATMYNLNCAERAGDPTEVAEAYSALGVIAGIAGLHPLARYYSDRALAVAEAIGQRSTQAFVHQLIAVYRHSLGQWDLVAHHTGRAIELFGEVGDRFRWEGCHAIEIMLHLHRCDIRALEEVSTRLHASAYPSSTAQILAWCQGGRLAAAILRDSVDETIIADLEAILDAHLPHGDRIWGYGLLAWAHHRLGHGNQAVHAARHALEIARRHPPGTYYVLRSLGATAEVLLDHWHRGPAPDADERRRRHREARAAVKALRGFARLVPVAVPAHWLHRGRLLAAEGHSRRAIAAWRRSLAAAERLALPWDLAHAALELGRAKAVPVPERVAYGQRAVTTLETLGDRLALRSAHTLVESLS